jgi:fructuronate reductase
MRQRLARDALARLPDAVRRPDFDPARLKAGIVHIGLGAFARAHLAWHTQPLLANSPDWAILGVSMRSPVASWSRQRIRPQSWLPSQIG